MALNNRSGLKVAGLAVALLGVFALVIVAAPVVRGQSVKYRPFTEIRTQIFGGIDIGVVVRDVDEADVKREKLAGAAGAVVEDVRAESPAAKAGVKAGDVIVSFDGERVRSAKHFTRLVQETPEGREVEATVVRAGEKVNLKVAPVALDRLVGMKGFEELRKFSATPRKDLELILPRLEFPKSYRYSFFDRSRGRLGIDVQDLTEQLGEYFGTPTGVLVTAVDPDTPAKTAGLKAGDVITKINGEQVRSSADLRRHLSTSGEVTITIMRDRKEMTIKSKLEPDGGRVIIR